MFSSLRVRLWLSYALMIATALVVVAVVLMLYLIGNPLLYRQTLYRLRAAEGLIMQRQDEMIRSGNLTALTRIAETLDVRVLIFSSDQTLRLDTNPADPPLGFPRKPMMPRGVPSLVDADGGFWLYTMNRLPGGETLVVSAPRPSVPVFNVFTDELLLPLLQGALVALILSLILAFLISRWIADPLQQVVAAARGYPSDEVKAVPARGPHEVQDLTRAFNAMVGRVHSSQKSQREFVANVSHELKTPLTSVRGFAQAILDGTADTPESRRQAAEVILNESGRMHSMVLDLLDLARLEAGTADLRMSNVDVRALLQGVVEKFRLQADEAGISLHIDLPSQMPTLMADGDRLAQVFINLVDNALKFSQAGGSITLRVLTSPNEMQFDVEDTGAGIPPEAIGRIFDRFYQADPSRPGGERHGAGLGLAIVQEIVQAHGGRISVRSQAGQGSTITLHLPLAQG
jgi:two-component system OmpR family sensor kinase